MSSLRDIHEKVRRVPVVRVSLSAIMTGLVYAFTVVFSLYIPQTRGFFNFGEIGVYIASLVGGPFVGFVAGGLGSALADVTLGYYHYAPATFIIKGIEGFIVGSLSERLEVIKGRTRVYLCCYPGIVAIAAIMYILGTNLYLGTAEVTFALGAIYEFTFNEVVWLIVSCIFCIITLYLTFKYLEVAGWILSMAAGGLEMVLGYFLYEQYILGFVAIAEVPFNVMQMLIGMFGATIVTHYLRRLRL